MFTLLSFLYTKSDYHVHQQQHNDAQRWKDSIHLLKTTQPKPNNIL